MLHPYFLWNEWKRGPEKFDTVNMLSREKWSKNLWKPAILPIKTLSRQNFGSTSSDLDVFSVSDTLNWYSSSRVFVLLTSVVVSLVVSIKSLNYIRSTTTTVKVKFTLNTLSALSHEKSWVHETFREELWKTWTILFDNYCVMCEVSE